MTTFVDEIIFTLSSNGISNNDFSQTKNEDYIISVMKELNEKNIKPGFSVNQTKTAEEAQKWRNEGNRLYLQSSSSEQLRSVFKLYSKSLAHAPVGSKEQALAYANISAILFKLEKYEKCLQVMDQCLLLNYPEDLKIKILMRKAECSKILQHSKAKESYDEALNWIENQVPINERDKMKKKLEDGLRKQVKVGKTFSDEEINSALVEFFYQNASNEIPCASDSIKLKYDQIHGRHLVASRDIRPGEIILNERPYTMITKNPYRYSHCWGCSEFAWNCIPCDKCVNVVYCSEKCKNESWESYHDFECEILADILELGMDPFGNPNITGLRFFILALKEHGSVENLKRELNKVDQSKDPRKKGFFDDEKFRSDKYISVYSLSNNYETACNDHFKIKAVCACAVLVTYVIATRSKLLNMKLQEDWSEMYKNSVVKFVACLIFKNIGIVDTNNYSPADLIYNGHSTCFLPASSFVNHSCCPNVFVIPKKPYAKMVTLLPIKKDDQIFNNYLGCLDKSKKERQFILQSNYQFVCNCVACKEDWPTEKGYLSLNGISLDHERKMRAEIETVKPIIETIMSHKIRFTKNLGALSNTLKSLCTVQEKLLKRVTMPCEEVYQLQNALKLFFEQLYVN